MILLILAIASLFGGVGAALAFFRGSIDESMYRNLLLVVTATWFVFATLWAYRKPH